LRKSFFACLLAFAASATSAAEDHRAWQHGVNLAWLGGKLLVVWASAGNPPQPNVGGDWPHDIYYAWLDLAAMRGVATRHAIEELAPVNPQTLVAVPEAQEPPSAAVNSKGTLLVTSEDGHGGINQNAGLWDSNLRELRAYPFQIRRGGHSGHAAAMGERFLVAYGEGWVDGGGWRGRGTGQNLHARIVGNDGARMPEVTLSAGQRDSWPLVAGSDRNWLVVWQRYPELALRFALVGASGKVLKQRRIAGDLPLRYAYDVAYSPDIKAYVVAGTSAGAGFISLVSRNGEITRTRKGLAPMTAESRLALGANSIGAYPAAPSGVAVVRISATAIEPLRIVQHPYAWDYSGTAGTFITPERLVLATLSTSGLRLFLVDLAR
jgi:hypothetical protein